MKFKRLGPWLALLPLLLAPCASAAPDQNQQVSLATKLAAALSHAKLKSVIVLDFSADDQKLRPLETRWADDLSSALAAQGGKFKVRDRAQLEKIVEDNYLRPKNFSDPGIAIWLAKEEYAEAVILGKLSTETDGDVSETAILYRAKGGKDIDGYKASLLPAPDMKALIAEASETADPLRSALMAGKCVPTGPIPCAGTHGYSLPKCASCPAPAFSPEALEEKMQGTVGVLAIIDKNGRAREAGIDKALPYGLTKAAVDAVRSWTFQPATGPDGMPAAVLQYIEVTFHLY